MPGTKTEGGGGQAREVAGGELGEGGEDVLNWGGESVVDEEHCCCCIGAFDLVVALYFLCCGSVCECAERARLGEKG